MSVRKVTIFGERCSGTNYLEELVTANFDVEICWNFGWKHFFNIDTIKRGVQHNNNDTSDILFICIVRNVKDWLNSLYKTPHHLPQCMLHKGVDYFLSSTAYSVDTLSVKEDGSNDVFAKEIEKKDDWHIYSNVRYKNIFELRYTKIKFLTLDLPRLVQNVFYIRHEDLCNHFETSMYNLHKAGLKMRSPSTFPQNVYFYKKEKDILFKDVPKAPALITHKHIEKYCDTDYLSIESSLYNEI